MHAQRSPAFCSGLLSKINLGKFACVLMTSVCINMVDISYLKQRVLLKFYALKKNKIK